MARGPGRDQIAPMERIMRIIALLNATEAAVPTERLVEVGGYRSDSPDSAKRMLSRDLDQLNAHGWDIRNVADPGESGRYRMFARDNRLQVRLSPAQRAELVRAATAMDHPEFASLLGVPVGGESAKTRVARVAVPQPLDAVLGAVSRRCRLHFVYKEALREVHPYAVHPGPSGWYLRAREVQQDRIKEFVIDRMRNVTLGRPGTAESLEDAPRLQLDPLSWQQDVPIEVTLETSAEHRAHVEQLLGTPRLSATVDGSVRMTYEVTNRGAFRWRVYELGMRVRVTIPDVFRDEIRRELEAIVEAAS